MDNIKYINLFIVDMKGFVCNNCGLCCSGDKGIQVNLTLGDIYRICEHELMTIDQFFKDQRYAGLRPFGDPRTPGIFDIDIGLNMPCKFRKDNKCMVYEARPLNCRLFPYWLLLRAKKPDLDKMLKGRCQYSLDKPYLKMYKEYQDILGQILLKESGYYVIDKKTSSKNFKDTPDITEIKSKIILNLDKIKMNNIKIIKAEKIIRE